MSLELLETSHAGGCCGIRDLGIKWRGEFVANHNYTDVTNALTAAAAELGRRVPKDVNTCYRLGPVMNAAGRKLFEDQGFKVFQGLGRCNNYQYIGRRLKAPSTKKESTKTLKEIPEKHGMQVNYIATLGNQMGYDFYNVLSLACRFSTVQSNDFFRLLLTSTSNQPVELRFTDSEHASDLVDFLTAWGFQLVTSFLNQNSDNTLYIYTR